MSIEQTRLTNFPQSVPHNEFVSHMYETFVGRGVGRNNTIVGVSVCREQPSYSFVEEIGKLLRHVFDFSIFGGMQFVGKSGFRKMQKSAADARVRFLYMAFPHVGWSSGEPSRLSATGQREPSAACQGLGTFQQELIRGAGLWEPDPDNLEQGLLNQQMFRNMKYGGGSDLVALTKLAYSIILKDVEPSSG